MATLVITCHHLYYFTSREYKVKFNPIPKGKKKSMDTFLEVARGREPQLWTSQPPRTSSLCLLCLVLLALY